MTKTRTINACRPPRLAGLAACLAMLANVGCVAIHSTPMPQATVFPPGQSAPGELNKTSLPPYIIEPPDILLIDAVRVAPRAPYKIQALDVTQIVVQGTLPDQPINGAFTIEPGGTVNLGPAYGKVRLQGLNLDEAISAVDKQLRTAIRNPSVTVTLLQTANQQQIQGDHLVGPDGTVNLGVYGTVYVAGLTTDLARQTIQTHLMQFLDSPEVAVSVFSYNSKVYYVITEGAGFGDNLARFPITGNETVLDALAQVNGRSRLSSKRIWIARPAPKGVGCDQILPVCWDDITKGAVTATNYQVFPGDRIFIAEDRLIAADSTLGRIISPFERIFGVVSLGSQAVQTVNRFPDGQNSGGNN